MYELILNLEQGKLGALAAGIQASSSRPQ
jgi:hypothetical protein